MVIGSRLKKRRCELKLTQGQLGELIGVGKAAICCYEKETRNPTIENIIELMHVLGVSADYLLGTECLVKTVSDHIPQYRTMTKEEIAFIDELRKDRLLYGILFSEPRRGADLIKKKIG